MRRREFIAGLGGAAVWPLAAQAQQTGVPVVAFVSVGSPRLLASRVAAFRKGLTETGYVEEQDVTIEYHWLEGQFDVLPRLMRVGYIYDPEFEPSRSVLEEVEKASRVLAVRTTAIAFHNAVDLVRGIDAFAAEPDGGLLIPPSVTAGNYRATINTLAIQYRLPTIYNTRVAFEGGLILYGARAADIMGRAAYFIDRILRGAKPSELPVEYPTRFELVVNLKTAKAIGVTIPETFLARADEVID
jgi:putative tryptophan/tyrosine transport system substrate-binding protein